jgi:methionyl-tRNA formyltransferase
MNVFISGQKKFGAAVLRLCISKGLNVVGVCCPPGDREIGRLAALNQIPAIPSGSLNAESMPGGVDLGIAAHSFDYVGRATRYKAKFGWIGYHPSLLPRHRGKSAIEWAIRMKDPVTGGTVFWLNAGIDRGDIESQDWTFIDPDLFVREPRKAAKMLWDDTLFEMGVGLLSGAIDRIASGVIIKTPQDNRFSTWEPGTDVKDIYRPDLLMIEAPQKTPINGTKHG